MQLWFGKQTHLALLTLLPMQSKQISLILAKNSLWRFVQFVSHGLQKEYSNPNLNFLRILVLRTQNMLKLNFCLLRLMSIYLLTFWDMEAITLENTSSRIWLVSSLPFSIENKYSGNLFSEILLIKTKSNRIFDFPEEK